MDRGEEFFSAGPPRPHNGHMEGRLTKWEAVDVSLSIQYMKLRTNRF